MISHPLGLAAQCVTCAEHQPQKSHSPLFVCCVWCSWLGVGEQKPRNPSFNSAGSELSRAGHNNEYKDLQTPDATEIGVSRNAGRFLVALLGMCDCRR